MFNLLWLHDMTQKVTDTWNFHVRCGFRGIWTASPIHQFFPFELYRKTCCKSAPTTSLVSRSFQLSCFLFRSYKLFILTESAPLITANDTDVRCQRALFNNEKHFPLSWQECALAVNWNKLLLGFFQVRNTIHESNSGRKNIMWLQYFFILWLLHHLNF